MSEKYEELFAVEDKDICCVCGTYDPDTKGVHDGCKEFVISAIEHVMKAAQPVEPVASFDAAWAEMEARGYRYGDDAIEQVRLGWNMRAAIVKGKEKP